MGEPLLTFRALERLFAAVEPSVLSEVVFVFESLLTIGAFVGTQVCKREGKNISGRIDGFSPECSYLCRVMELFLVNVLSHWSQLKTPVASSESSTKAPLPPFPWLRATSRSGSKLTSFSLIIASKFSFDIRPSP